MAEPSDKWLPEVEGTPRASLIYANPPPPVQPAPTDQYDKSWKPPPREGYMVNPSLLAHKEDISFVLFVQVDVKYREGEKRWGGGWFLEKLLFLPVWEEVSTSTL